MEQLPVFLNLKDRRCVVVGAGAVAARKARLLVKAGARLVIIAESVCAEIRLICTQANGHIEVSAFKSEHLNGAALVIAATDDANINRAVSEHAHAQNIPVNVVDQPALCSFTMPAIVDRSPVLIAISSGGNSPLLTRKLKELNEIMLPQRVNELAELLGSFRPAVKDSISDFDDRIRFWEAILESEIPELVYSGNAATAQQLIEDKLNRFEDDSQAKQGEVYLVGAGPGDPELLTLRALRLMQKADVVLYDRLVSTEIMEKLRPDAEKIHVGKAPSKHTMEQGTINQLLSKLAKEGKRVLRLKGGDPFIFGRGGEELETLSEAGINFQVVPGITAASGCAAYAGIPLTHRDYSQSVRFLTAHTKEGDLPLKWDLLVKEQQTLVFYMGLTSLALICRELIAHGMDEEMPVAVIQQGTTLRQKVISSVLRDIVAKVEAAELKAPTMIIIGNVVKLRDGLNWYQASD